MQSRLILVRHAADSKPELTSMEKRKAAPTWRDTLMSIKILAKQTSNEAFSRKIAEALTIKAVKPSLYVQTASVPLIIF